MWVADSRPCPQPLRTATGRPRGAPPPPPSYSTAYSKDSSGNGATGYAGARGGGLGRALDQPDKTAVATKGPFSVNSHRQPQRRGSAVTAQPTLDSAGHCCTHALSFANRPVPATARNSAATAATRMSADPPVRNGTSCLPSNHAAAYHVHRTDTPLPAESPVPIRLIRGYWSMKSGSSQPDYGIASSRSQTLSVSFLSGKARPR